MSNRAGFESSAVDSLLDELALADDHKVCVAQTGAAHRAILNKVPVSNLVMP